MVGRYVYWHGGSGRVEKVDALRFRVLVEVYSPRYGARFKVWLPTASLRVMPELQYA